MPWAHEAYEEKPNSQDECGVGERGGIIVCGRWTRSARPRGLGGDFEFLPLKSPRNPITPIETSRVATLHPELYKNLREGARRGLGATAKPLYAIDGKAEGLDLRNPRPPSSREGDRPVGGGRSKRRRRKAFVPIAFMPNIILFSDARQAYEAQEAYEAYEE